MKNFISAKVRPVALGDFLKAFLGDTRAFAGCINVDVYADESAASYTLVEEWVTFADHDYYVAWRTATGNLDETGDLLDDGIENGLSVYV